jgi:hypothetical protein
MSILKAVLRGWRIGTGIGTPIGGAAGKAIGNALSSKGKEFNYMPISSEEWARRIMRQAGWSDARTGRQLNLRIDAITDYQIKHMFDNNDPFILFKDGHVGNAIATMLEFIVDGEPRNIPCLCPPERVREIKNDFHLNQLVNAISKQGMSAYWYDEDGEKIWQGKRYKICVLYPTFDEKRTWHP